MTEEKSSSNNIQRITSNDDFNSCISNLSGGSSFTTAFLPRMFDAFLPGGPDEIISGLEEEKYVCPKCKRIWYRHSVGERIKVCTADNELYIRAEESPVLCEKLQEAILSELPLSKEEQIDLCKALFSVTNVDKNLEGLSLGEKTDKIFTKAIKDFPNLASIDKKSRVLYPRISSMLHVR